jgi:hypothetical protein
VDKRFLLGLIFTLFFTPSVMLAETAFQTSLPCEPVIEDSCESYSHNFWSPFTNGKSSYIKNTLWGQIKFDGWIQTGFYTNNHSTTTSRSRGTNSKGQYVSSPDFSSGNSTLLTTLRSTDWQVNQLWLNAHKDADTSKGWDWVQRFYLVLTAGSVNLGTMPHLITVGKAATILRQFRVFIFNWLMLIYR